MEFLDRLKAYSDYDCDGECTKCKVEYCCRCIHMTIDQLYTLLAWFIDYTQKGHDNYD